MQPAVNVDSEDREDLFDVSCSRTYPAGLLGRLTGFRLNDNAYSVSIKGGRSLY